MDTENTKDQVKKPEKKTKSGKRRWNFPRLGISVMANSLEEAKKEIDKSTNK